MLGKLALRDIDLATATHCPAATDRININPKAASCIQNGRAKRESSALSRRCEYDPGVFLAHQTERRLRVRPPRPSRPSPATLG
jgi:hypothetical protein